MDRTTAKAQQLLRVKSDGHWGPKTQAAYDGATPEVREAVRAVYAAEGRRVPALASRSEVTAAIEAAAADTNSDPHLLRMLAYIESRYNPRAVNGASKGLMQFQRAAWDIVRPSVQAMPDFDQGWADPYWSAVAAALYAKRNAASLRKRSFSGEIDAAVIYMCHQQGAGGFWELYQAMSGKVPSTNYVTRDKMVLNPPPDKLGVTIDRAEFCRRWLVYLRELGRKM